MAEMIDIRRTVPATMRIAPWPAPDGWPLRRFDWPALDHGAPRGSALFVGGRGDFIEKYLESLYHLHGRGWALSGFDWRGQGGSGRFLADRTIGHTPDFAPLIDDAAAFVAEWIAETPGPHVLIGHSMGGHLLLRLLAERTVAADAAILVAPMLGLATAPMPYWLARLVARTACRIGLGERPAWSEGERPELSDARRRRNLTHCPDRYADEAWWRSASPENMVGPPTWGWLAAATRSIDSLNEPGVLERVRMPLLLLATPRDRLVSSAAIERAARRLPQATLRLFADGAHELLRESDPVRLAVFSAMDDFLDTQAPQQ